MHHSLTLTDNVQKGFSHLSIMLMPQSSWPSLGQRCVCAKLSDFDDKCHFGIFTRPFPAFVSIPYNPSFFTFCVCASLGDAFAGLVFCAQTPQRAPRGTRVVPAFSTTCSSFSARKKEHWDCFAIRSLRSG